MEGSAAHLETSTIMFARREVEADDFLVACFEAGPKAAEDLPLVVLHGAGGPELPPAYATLAERLRIVYFEMPGFGTSPPNERTATIAELAETMGTAIRALGIERFHLLGTSFGGAVALRLALAHEELVESLILECPAAFRPYDDPPPQLAPEELRNALFAHPERRPPGPPPDPATVAKQLSLVGRLMATENHQDLSAALANLRTPTMVMFGTRDGLVPPEMGRRYKELIANCDYVLVYDAAHAISFDRPEAFVALVEDFVRRGPAHVVNIESTIIHP